MLDVCLVKPLSGFDKRQIVRSCPRSDVDHVYTPVLDKFLSDLVPKYKSEDTVLLYTRDLLLNVADPIVRWFGKPRKKLSRWIFPYY